MRACTFAAVVFTSFVFLPSTGAAASASLRSEYSEGGSYDGLSGLELLWRTTSSHLEIALISSSPSTTWMGFGLAEPTVGQMKGSDIVFASVDDEGNAVVRDTFAVAQRLPITDCNQDWEATSGSVDADGAMVVELRRLLDTGDGQDRPVSYGLDNAGRGFRVVLAHGSSASAVLSSPGEISISNNNLRFLSRGGGLCWWGWVGGGKISAVVRVCHLQGRCFLARCVWVCYCAFVFLSSLEYTARAA